MSDENQNSQNHMTTDQTLLARARKARFDDLPNFSGHPSEDVERFLKTIKTITKANNENENREILEIVRGKLTKSAGIWFDNNEHTFKKWSDFETAFRNRYFSTTAIHKKFDKLKQRKQLFDEPVTTYIDDIVNLCKEVDPTMSDPIIIQHLMSGLNPNLRMEICRHDSCIHTLHEFMKYAKIEQDLYDTFGKSRTSSPELTQRPYYDLNNTTTPQVTTMIRQPRQQYKDIKQDGRHTYAMPARNSVVQRNSNYQMQNTTTTSDNRVQNYPRRHTYYNKSANNQISYQHRINNCKIYGRTNHSTINCFYKCTTGCFKCGQNHHIRDCTMPQNFQ